MRLEYRGAIFDFYEMGLNYGSINVLLISQPGSVPYFLDTCLVRGSFNAPALVCPASGLQVIRATRLSTADHLDRS
jgi:hypothetical protein